MGNKQEIIVDKLLSLMDKHGLFWRKGWATLSMKPRNPVSHWDYHGINFWILTGEMLDCNYPTNQWVTYKQAQSVGGQVRKGEHGTPIRTPITITQMKKDADGTEKEVKIPSIKVVYVFNVAQVDGAEFVQIVNPNDRAALPVSERFDLFVNSIPHAPEVLRGEHRPSYLIDSDKITLPSDQFWLGSVESVIPFYREYAHLHELGHAMGHESRTGNAIWDEKGTPEYWAEELKAELFASFAMAECGISTDGQMENTAAYLKGYKDALAADKGFFIRCAKDAEERFYFAMGQSLDYNKPQTEVDAA